MAGPGTHESFERERVAAPSDRAFGYVLAGVFAIVGLWPMTSGESPRLWVLSLAIVAFALALLWAPIYRPFNRIWFGFGILLQRVLNPIILGLIFFLGVLPTALIMRLRGRDRLRIAGRNRRESNWIIRAPPGPPPETMKHLF